MGPTSHEYLESSKLLPSWFFRRPSPLSPPPTPKPSAACLGCYRQRRLTSAGTQTDGTRLPVLPGNIVHLGVQLCVGLIEADDVAREVLLLLVHLLEGVGGLLHPRSDHPCLRTGGVQSGNPNEAKYMSHKLQAHTQTETSRCSPVP